MGHMKIKGNVAFITGGGGAIGNEIARQLSSKGIAVALADADGAAAEKAAAQIKEQGGRSLAMTLDITKRERIDEAVRHTRDILGTIEILVHCAGIYPNSLVQDMAEEEWIRCGC